MRLLKAANQMVCGNRTTSADVPYKQSTCGSCWVVYVNAIGGTWWVDGHDRKRWRCECCRLKRNAEMRRKKNAKKVL